MNPSTLTDNELELLIQLTDLRGQLAHSEMERNRLLIGTAQGNLRALMVEQERRDEAKKAEAAKPPAPPATTPE